MLNQELLKYYDLNGNNKLINIGVIQSFNKKKNNI